jgi:uncharacterized membrane protein YphA (DoxX/SURF4 family)
MEGASIKHKDTEGLWFLLTRLALGGVFIYASIDKIIDPADFARVVYSYKIFPDILINVAALFIPWLELVLGLCLLSGIGLPGAILMSNGLLWAFFLALLINHFRGLDVQCGCFATRSPSVSAPPMAWYLFRDPVFLLAAGYLLSSLFFIPRK